MIKIGIIDDNILLTEVLDDYLSTLDDMKIIGIAHNGLDGMELIKREQLDLVILDLVMPHSDGLSLLKQLQKEKIDTKVLMLTAFGKEDVIQKASEYGVSYFLLKPFELSNLSDTIREICSKKEHRTTVEAASPNKLQEDNLEVLITDVLRSMGIPANLKGYHFLRDAIQMVIENDELLNGLGGITKVIYPTIAKKYHTTPTRVERGIRHSIEVGWNRGNIEVLNYVFGNTVSSLKNKPTNGKFIALIADYLKVKKAS
nr:sporulation transcription factor Spo0A [Neobacillus sp. Marseille-Q6967]